jgi:membrane protease YdiL (CAAX protease family)
VGNDRPANARSMGLSSIALVSLLCWTAMLAASDAPIILARETAGTKPPWLAGVQVGALATLLLLTWLSRALAAARRVILAFLAFQVGWSLLMPVVHASEPWTEWQSHATPGRRIIATTLIPLIPVMLVALTLIGSGLKGRDVFLTWGDWRAPTGLEKLVGTQGPITWRHMAAPYILAASVWLAAYSWVTLPPDAGNLGLLFNILPAVLLAAAINAATEEFQFRAIVLAYATPALGEEQALWLSSVLFGLAHWYGTPAGPMGVLTTLIGGWVVGRSMLATRGAGWAWVMHWVSDIVVYAFLIVTKGGFTIAAP